MVAITKPNDFYEAFDDVAWRQMSPEDKMFCWLGCEASEGDLEEEFDPPDECWVISLKQKGIFYSAQDEETGEDLLMGYTTPQKAVDALNQLKKKMPSIELVLFTWQQLVSYFGKCFRFVAIDVLIDKKPSMFKLIQKQ